MMKIEKSLKMPSFYRIRLINFSESENLEDQLGGYELVDLFNDLITEKRKK